MRIAARCLLAALITTACYADLTTDQKVSDFLQLSGLYAKNYAPYEWKRDVIGVDLYNVKPWLDKVKASQTDVEFWDICVQYVASLQDSHDEYTINSTFEAWLHFDVDIYDGKVIIDGIDRSWLPKKDYPFTVGDELVSVDGKPVADLITAFIPYSVNGSGSKSTRRRLAAETIVDRYQGYMPRAHEVPDQSTIVVERAGGAAETYSITWDKFGTPLTTAGIVPIINPASDGPRALRIRRPKPAPVTYTRHGGDSAGPSRARAWGVWAGETAKVPADPVPAYMKPLAELQQMSALQPDRAAAAFGLFSPAFDPPAGFKLRLGASSSDNFLSGTFPAGTATIGFIRIPTMSPPSTTAALKQFASEIAYMDKNTSALVVDVMRNGGGSLCYDEQLMAYLTSGNYTAANYNIRVTDFWLSAFASNLELAKQTGAPQWVIDLYGAYVKDMQNALKDNRSLSGTLPICGPLATLTGSTAAYSKPIVALVDDFSLSAAESFAMMLQDAGRATIIGTRTDGGGGNPASYSAGVYSEGSTRVTRSFVVRGKSVQTPAFPASQWLENTGVYPDVQADIMTLDNLLGGGTPFLTQVGVALGAMLK